VDVEKDVNAKTYDDGVSWREETHVVLASLSACSNEVQSDEEVKQVNVQYREP
jgi:hypothetical protein